MRSNSFDVGQVLEVVLRDGSDLEDEGSEEECLKFKKVIWTVFIMSFAERQFLGRIVSTLNAM